jgi:predicted nucleic acid-binding protein
MIGSCAAYSRFRFLPVEEPSDYEAAAGLYRTCRRSGTTVRRLPDCLIAMVAIRNRVELLHCDSHFEAIARHAPLSIVPLAPLEGVS